MYKSVAEYLRELRRELAGCDSAIIQDALADAEEHFASVPGWGASDSGNVNEGISSLLETFGTPQEVAAAYREMEIRLPLPLNALRRKESKSLLGKFFGVAAEIQT